MKNVLFILITMMMTLFTLPTNAQKVYSVKTSEKKTVLLKMNTNEVKEWKSIQKDITYWSATKAVAQNASKSGGSATTTATTIAMSNFTEGAATTKLDNAKKKENEFVKKNEVKNYKGTVSKL